LYLPCPRSNWTFFQWTCPAVNLPLLCSKSIVLSCFGMLDSDPTNRLLLPAGTKASSVSRGHWRDTAESALSGYSSCPSCSKALLPELYTQDPQWHSLSCSLPAQQSCPMISSLPALVG
jgi:hypothetical protein